MALASPALAAGTGPHLGLFAPGGARLPFAGTQHAVCGTPTPGGAMCMAHVLQPTATAATPAGVVSSPTGLPPSTIDGVYGFSSASTTGSTPTIALVDAYNDPNAVGDLTTFDTQYGLPAPPSFSQVSQTGTKTLPATNASWDLEISLDIEWAHAMAPGADILLVEATTNSLTNLLAAEKYASAHAQYVSNSWGASESSGESSNDSYFSTPGVDYFASTGDTASELSWPATSPTVTSVGGTSLTLTSGHTLAQESAWSAGGGGCSADETANPAQKTGSISCSGKRATPDFSLDADPNSGVSVYDSVTYDSQSGWWTVGGTSASTAMIAGEAAANASTSLSAASVYGGAPSINLRDITLGSNGHAAGPGYDLATGLGSWSNTPGAPTGLTATGAGANTINLAWSAPTGAAVSSYVIWRGTASGQESTQIGTATTPSFGDTGATGSTTYYYEVEAINSLGNGPFSSEAHATSGSSGGGTAPVAKFTKSCSSASCNFTSTSTGTISTYAWNGGNGTTGSASTFSDTYAKAGNYTVSLTVAGSAGQSSASTTVSCKSTGFLFLKSVSCS
jgi:subtilase family serine protease